VTSAMAIEIYSDKLKAYCADGKIIEEDQASDLGQMRALLGLEMSDVADVHDEVCAPAYRTSVREVMGSTGIIPDEYWEGLTVLRERLGLSEDAAKALFAAETTEKMRGFAQKAMDAMQEKAEKQQKAQEEGKSGSLGVDDSPISAEITHLLDFATASKALVTEDGKDVIGADLRGEFAASALKELYKQYLVEAFSTSNAEQNERVFNNLPRLTLVLGLTAKEVELIHNEIGSRIYRQYISKAIKKGPLGAEETQFLGSIKQVLGMQESLCQELIKDVQLNYVSILVESMFEKSSVLAEDVRKMRDTADLYDIDLAGDLQIPSIKLERMFLCELEDLVDSGELRPDDLSPIAEVCEPLHISEGKAQALLEETVQKRVSGGILQAAACMRQSEKDGAISELGRALKYAALLESDASVPAVSEGERSELYVLYQSSVLASGVADGQEQLDLLKALLKLGAAASA